MLDTDKINQFAQVLDEAAANVKAVGQISKVQSFSESEAYAIQFASMQRRFDRGEKFVGIKMGFTSKAKMEQMGVNDMIWGILTDAMLIKPGTTTPFSKYIHPRVEPELCFLVKKTIDRPLTKDDIPSYVEGVAAAIEIIDSRYENFKFSLEDVIADNCSSTGLCIGEMHPIDADISDLKIDLIVDGEVVQSGSSKAILGDPWESFLAGSRLASKYEWKIPAGSYVMAGAATSAVYLKEGNKVSAVVEGLGEVEFGV